MGKVFISYSHQDEVWRKRLEPHLKALAMEGDFQVWDDTRIQAGADWLAAIETALNQADAVILLISADFLASPFIRSVEVPQALTRRRHQGIQIIPLIVRDCAWKNVPWLSAMQCVPLNGRPLSTFTKSKRDTELATLAQTLLPHINPVTNVTPIHPINPTPITPTHAAISLSRLPVTGEKLFGRATELQRLHEAWADPHTHIISLVAWGGVGKTALVNHWLNDLQDQNYAGAQKVFGWSFYSQGAAAGKQASADEFFQETLAWFGDPEPEKGSAVEKGRRLARLVQHQPTLLILDGLEPLQYPLGEVSGLEGRLKDGGMAAFLKELAMGQNQSQGLCVITTREGLVDLQNRRDHGVKEMALEHLSVEAGVVLLRALGVTGGLPRDFQQAVAEYEGHALALTLLGVYIQSAYQGDLRKRDNIRGLTGVKKAPGFHAQRVMAAYETLYMKYPKWKFLRRFKRCCSPSPELSILYIMGLFDRPVEKVVFDVLLKKPAIRGVTDHLVGLREAEVQVALSHLRGLRLLAADKAGKNETLDCHPLVREYFGARLRETHEAGWQAAHLRLYRYFKNLPKKQLPDTLEEMEPLFAAVSHGCKAGLHEEVRYEVYDKRIQRGGKTNYCCTKLGAFGADLAALSHFFAIPWSQPVAGLAAENKALVLSWAAFGLRALGRLPEAVQPMKAGLELGIQQEDWKGAAIRASNLSELLLTRGDVPGAVVLAQQSVSHADRSGDEFMMEATRTALADALHVSGANTAAEKWFREAEDKQKQRQPQFPFLYSLQGYQFCDLLLDQPGPAGVQEVLTRAEKAIEVAKQSGFGLLSFALDQLTLGRAWLKVAVEQIQPLCAPPNDPLAKAHAFLEEAVEGLRRYGSQQHLPRGLLARAAYYRFTKAYDKAWTDLQETHDIAELGGMKLHLCDYFLEAAALCRDWGKDKEAAEYREKAGQLIKETGKGGGEKIK